jgi:hypothetical protein
MFLIRVYHRSLNKKELGIKELLEDIAAQEEARKAERRKKGVIIYEEKRKVPKEQKAENGN